MQVAHELRGPMAPGLSQRLLVSFTGATELGHVSDAIQVQTEVRAPCRLSGLCS
jgi:hypothetical protein